ncbi:MAG: hypothetical protein GWP19_11950 [Planctomycetia bacterium]|nr:hypothetical protein [Planctomycetia bacterium]
MNPFLKHPILQFVSYEMMKKPTLEGIKIDLKKESEKGKWSRIILPSFWIIYFLVHIVQGKIVWGAIDIVLGVCGFLILGWEGKRQFKRFHIDDKDILKQIELHKEWSNNKSQ